MIDANDPVTRRGRATRRFRSPRGDRYLRPFRAARFLDPDGAACLVAGLDAKYGVPLTVVEQVIGAPVSAALQPDALAGHSRAIEYLHRLERLLEQFEEVLGRFASRRAGSNYPHLLDDPDFDPEHDRDFTAWLVEDARGRARLMGQGRFRGWAGRLADRGINAYALMTDLASLRRLEKLLLREVGQGAEPENLVHHIFIARPRSPDERVAGLNQAEYRRRLHAPE